MIIHEVPNFIQVSYSPGKDYILFDWTDFLVTLEQIKVIHQKALDVAVQKQIYFYVAETSKVNSVLRSEVIKWWGEEWVPKLTAAGLKAIVTVVPMKVGLASISTHNWQVQVVGSIVMKNVRSLAEAESYLKEFNHGS